MADADALVEEVLADTELDAVDRLAQAFPLRVFPDAVGIPQPGRGNLLPYGGFNAFGPANDLVAKGAPRAAELLAWTNAQCGRDVLAPEGFGTDIWAAADRGDITPKQAPLIVRSLLSAGVDTTVHGMSAGLYAFATNPNQRDHSQPAHCATRCTAIAHAAPWGASSAAHDRRPRSSVSPVRYTESPEQTPQGPRHGVGQARAVRALTARRDRWPRAVVP